GRCGGGSLPDEPVRVGEGVGGAAEDDAVRAGAVGGDADLLGQGAALVQRHFDGVGPTGGELDVHAADALGHGHAPADVELLGGLHVLDADQQDDLVDLAGVGAGVLLRRGRDL